MSQTEHGEPVGVLFDNASVYKEEKGLQLYRVFLRRD